MPLRHLAAILILPFVVVVVVPHNLLRRSMASGVFAGNPVPLGLRSVSGAAIFLVGFAFFSRCVWLFGRVGKGTLAPWDPTRRLVAVGPYRYVRNPMISGVLLMLIGEALFFGSRPIGVWAGIFLAFNHVYFLLLEEPGLEARFGDAYGTYKAHVPRWIPRLRPWDGG